MTITNIVALHGQIVSPPFGGWNETVFSEIIFSFQAGDKT